MYEKILCALAIWTLAEGAVVMSWPKGAIAVSQKLFPKWGSVLAGMESSELRKLGGIELAFGLLLGSYLLWAN
jgi:hypothetical protein